MDKWTHVFVRNDAVRGPLNSPYLGPFRVLSRAKKHFMLNMNSRTGPPVFSHPRRLAPDRLRKA